ncbi:MAG: hypothetical protein HY606_11565 [Planctomycetes bacterium]|nr:hypothetical protein [Planctomycetota bacterium]
MNKIITCLLVVVFSNSALAGGGNIKWDTEDLDKGFQLAKESWKPIFLYFGSDG